MFELAWLKKEESEVWTVEVALHCQFILKHCYADLKLKA